MTDNCAWLLLDRIFTRNRWKAHKAESSGVSSAVVDISIHGTGVPPLRLFAPSGILATGGRKADELEELDEEPELSELKDVESEDVVAGATASGEATSGGLSTFFRRNDSALPSSLR